MYYSSEVYHMDGWVAIFYYTEFVDIPSILSYAKEKHCIESGSYTIELPRFGVGGYDCSGYMRISKNPEMFKIKF